jgi:hypothetical protein
MSPYTAGDSVKLYLEFDHEAADIETAWASYEPESGQGTALDLYANGDAVKLEESGELTNIYSATLTGEVTDSHDRGTYRCTELRAQTVGGKRLEFSRLPPDSLDIAVGSSSTNLPEQSGLVQLRKSSFVE